MGGAPFSELPWTARPPVRGQASSSLHPSGTVPGSWAVPLGHPMTDKQIYLLTAVDGYYDTDT